MGIETYGQQIEVTPALRDYVETKLRRVVRHADDEAVQIRTQLSVRKPDHVVEATLNMPGCTLHADASGQTMYAAIDLLADKLDRLVLKHKGKKQEFDPLSVRDGLQ